VRTPKGNLLARPTDSQKSWSCVRKPPNKISKNKISKYVHILLSLLYIIILKTSQENKKCPKCPPPVYYYILPSGKLT
jgi:hypothetical protein